MYGANLFVTSAMIDSFVFHRTSPINEFLHYLRTSYLLLPLPKSSEITYLFAFGLAL